MSRDINLNQLTDDVIDARTKHIIITNLNYDINQTLDRYEITVKSKNGVFVGKGSSVQKAVFYALDEWLRDYEARRKEFESILQIAPIKEFTTVTNID